MPDLWCSHRISMCVSCSRYSEVRRWSAFSSSSSTFWPHRLTASLSSTSRVADAYLLTFVERTLKNSAGWGVDGTEELGCQHEAWGQTDSLRFASLVAHEIENVFIVNLLQGSNVCLLWLRLACTLQHDSQLWSACQQVFQHLFSGFCTYNFECYGLRSDRSSSN